MKKVLDMFATKDKKDKKKNKWEVKNNRESSYRDRIYYTLTATKRFAVGNQTYCLKSHLKYNFTDSLLYMNVQLGDVSYHEEVGTAQGYNSNYILLHFDEIIYPTEKKFLESLESFVSQYRNIL